MKGTLTLALFFFAAAVFTSLLFVTSFSTFLIYVLLLLLINVAPWLLLLRRSKNPASDFLLMPVLIVTLDIFVLRSGLLGFYKYIDNSWHPFVTSDVLNKATLLILVGNLSLWLGYIAFKQWGNGVVKAISQWSETEFVINESRIWALFLLAILLRVYLVSQGQLGYFGSVSGRESIRSVVQFFGLFESLAPLTLCLYFALLLKNKGSANWPGFIIMLILELTTIFLIGFKGQLVYRFIYLAIVYAFIKQRLPRQLVLLGILVLIVVYPINMTLRVMYTTGSFEAGDVNAIFSGTGEITTDVFSGQSEQFMLREAPERILRTSAQLEEFAMAVQYTDRTGGLQGEDLKFMAYSVIPRIIWPSKPIIGARGAWFNTEVYGYSTASAKAVTVPGTFYLNFGWPGIVLGFFFFGLLLRVGQTVLVRSKGNLRLAALVPFIIFALALPNSMFFNHLVGSTRSLLFLFLVLHFFLTPKLENRSTATYFRPLSQTVFQRHSPKASIK